MMRFDIEDILLAVLLVLVVCCDESDEDGYEIRDADVDSHH